MHQFQIAPLALFLVIFIPSYAYILTFNEIEIKFSKENHRERGDMKITPTNTEMFAILILFN